MAQPGSGGKLVVALVAAALALAGCEGGAPEKKAKDKPRPKPAVVKIPTRNVNFLLVNPGKEKRSGLYARWVSGEESLGSMQEMFASLADSGQKLLRATEGGWPMLVGKLPGTVYNGDFFQAETGTIKGGSIKIPGKFVWWAIKGAKRAPRTVYFTVTLPALPAGKYRAAVVFGDYIYEGDRKKIRACPMKGFPKRPPRFPPLTCQFEVRPAR